MHFYRHTLSGVQCIPDTQHLCLSTTSVRHVFKCLVCTFCRSNKTAPPRRTSSSAATPRSKEGDWTTWVQVGPAASSPSVSFPFDIISQCVMWYLAKLGQFSHHGTKQRRRLCRILAVVSDLTQMHCFLTSWRFKQPFDTCFAETIIRLLIHLRNLCLSIEYSHVTFIRLSCCNISPGILLLYDINKHRFVTWLRLTVIPKIQTTIIPSQPIRGFGNRTRFFFVAYLSEKLCFVSSAIITIHACGMRYELASRPSLRIQYFVTQFLHFLSWVLV